MIASGSPDCRAQTASARRFELRRSCTAERGSRIPFLPGRSVRERLSGILTTSEFSNIGANGIRDRTGAGSRSKAEAYSVQSFLRGGRSQLFSLANPRYMSCARHASGRQAHSSMRSVAGGQDALLNLLTNHVMEIDFPLSNELVAVRSLVKKFATVPLAFADACLVRMSELQTSRVLLTLDSDFCIYRRNQRQVTPVSMPRRGA